MMCGFVRASPHTPVKCWYFFLCSGSSVIIGSVRKQNATGDVVNVVLSINSREQSQFN